MTGTGPGAYAKTAVDRRARLIQIKPSCDQLCTLCPHQEHVPLMAPRPKSCSECAVRETALCRVLSPQQLSHLNRRSYRRWYPSGQLIAGVAASEDWCATVMSGVIKLSKTLSDGRQQIVALLFPGDFLGRPYRAEFPYTAETATEVQLCCYDRTHFHELLQEQSDLKQLFLERTLDLVDAARDWMLLLGRKTAREKVAAFLHTILQRTSQLCPECEPSLCRQLALPLTRTEMADYLGLRLETVSRQLKQLEASAIIRRVDPRRISVCDAQALARAAGPDLFP
ncbi:MAG: helix-turn-helix domain-containing protein [Rhodospirillales bacterium]|nr:helix-turn-helix domain-containing protein [Rhodospirillales bacterium]